LGPGDKIHFFLEEDAFVDGKLDRPKERAVNKIGHGKAMMIPLISANYWQLCMSWIPSSVKSL
jgi:hypothetical protein